MSVTCEGCGFIRRGQNEWANENPPRIVFYFTCWRSPDGAVERQRVGVPIAEKANVEYPPACCEKVASDQQCSYCSNTIPVGLLRCPTCGASR
jgi:hypothetical protein